MAEKPVHEIGPSNQAHGHKVIVDHSECRVIIYTEDAEKAKYAAFNVSRQYSGILNISIVGY